MLDASLVPYLSSRIDAKYSGHGMDCHSDCSAGDSVSSSYGTVYAIQQMAVSLAYSMSPLLASEVVKFMGFPILMMCIGLMNVAYAAVFYYFTATPCARTVSEVWPGRDKGEFLNFSTIFRDICSRKRTTFWGISEEFLQ